MWPWRKSSKRQESTEEAPSRRQALGALGLLGTSALVAGCEQKPTADPFAIALDKPWVPGAERYDTNEERFIHSSCGQCPAGCGIRVRVVEGRAVRIEGNARNPINQGGIGPRGLSGLQVLYDPDRIAGPLVRKNGALVPTTWQEGERLLARALTALRATGHPEKLLVLSGAQRGFGLELLARFCEAFGTPNLVDGRPSRTSVLAQAMQATLGHFEIPAFDWTGARYVVSFEAGLLEDSCQAVFFARAAGHLRRGHAGQRAKLVHVGPSFDLSAHNADEWIQIEPGTSGAFALGLCHVVLGTNRHDARFVETSTSGFEAFREHVAAFTPARVAGLTGARAQDIVRIAHELVEMGSAFGFMDERTLSYSNGWDTALSILGLNALLGAPQRATGGMSIEPAAPYAAWPALELDEVARAGRAHPRLDRAGSPEFPLARSIHETLPDAIAADPPEIVLLHHANPVYARPQGAKRWREALARVPLVVSFSPFLDESVAELAHLVLPDHTFLERWEDAAAAPGIGRAVAGIRRPAIEPLLDTRPTGDVLLDVARSIGGKVAAAMPWRTFRGALEARLVGLHAAARGSIVAPTERAFLTRLYDEGFWTDKEAPSPPAHFAFQSAHTDVQWLGAPERYPLKLIVFRPLGYAEGSGANQPWLRFLRARPDSTYWSTPCSVHPDSAPEGLHDGDDLEVQSAWGSIVVPMRLDATVRRGCVTIPVGGGHTAFGRWAQGFGANPLRLLAPGPAPRTGAGILCNTRVRIRRATREA